MVSIPAQPYCGAPPLPAELWSRWNLDPVLVASLAVPLALYAARAARAGVAPWRRAVFYGGWGLTSLALLSPLCALSVALFSARVAQHMVLTTIAAPLVALGRPWGVAGAGYRAHRPGSGAFGPVWAAAAYGVILWFWHAPGPYAATFHGDLVYWLMHLTLFGSAVWLWSELLDHEGDRFAGVVGGVALTSLQMGVLGAVLTFAGRPLYAPHVLTAWTWGLSPLEDQQLGGVLMWAPSGAIFAAGLGVAFARLLDRPAAAGRGARA